MPRRIEQKPTKPKRARSRKLTAPPVIDDGIVNEAPLVTLTAPPDRSTLLWGSVIGIVIVIIGVWVIVFRWSLVRMKPSLSSSSLANVKNEVQKNLGDFQKSFESISQLIEQRFATLATGTSTVSLPPDTVKELQARIEAVSRGATTSPLLVVESTRVPLEYDRALWQEFRSSDHALRLRYPPQFALDARAVTDDRIAAFVTRRTDGTYEDTPLVVLTVRLNMERAPLREFYTAPDRVNLFQAARGGTTSVSVDGVRALVFHQVEGIVPTTVVSVRRGTRVYELSVLGADPEHEELIKKIIGTVRFQ